MLGAGTGHGRASHGEVIAASAGLAASAAKGWGEDGGQPYGGKQRTKGPRPRSGGGRARAASDPGYFPFARRVVDSGTEGTTDGTSGSMQRSLQHSRHSRADAGGGSVERINRVYHTSSGGAQPLRPTSATVGTPTRFGTRPASALGHTSRSRGQTAYGGFEIKNFCMGFCVIGRSGGRGSGREGELLWRAKDVVDVSRRKSALEVESSVAVEVSLGGGGSYG